MSYLDRQPGDPEWGHAYGPGADGVRLHYVRRGHGEPVVLLHGWPGFWYDWRRVVVPLAEEVDVIALDFRGFGDSDKPEGDPKELYTADRLAADVLALLDHLGVGRFVVAGHDTGAVIAQVLARTTPERVSALVLFNPPHSAIGDKPQELASQRESWYHHFHALPWSDQLVGFSGPPPNYTCVTSTITGSATRIACARRSLRRSSTPSPDPAPSGPASAGTGLRTKKRRTPLPAPPKTRYSYPPL